MTSQLIDSTYERQLEEWRRGLIWPLWESPTAHKKPPKPSRPQLWRWEELRRFSEAAAKITSPEAVERRVLSLMNPEPKSATDESTVGNLAAAIQILLPGESARPHRHSMHALRFVIEGEGATTIVNGKSIPMHVNDMLLTPGNCWHQHHHAGDQPMFWLDALDVPLHNALGIVTFQPGPIPEIPRTVPDAAFAQANLLPVQIDASSEYSPVFAYTYSSVVAALEHAPVGRDKTRTVRYVNPLNGSAPMSTMDCRMVELAAGVSTTKFRTNASSLFLAVEGKGVTTVNGTEVSWGPRDIVTIPQNSWMQHKAETRARLFLISDREMLRRLAFLEETYED